jgi:hypothetical protein
MYIVTVVYQVQLGFKGSKVNAIIPLLEEAPLFITKNISKPLHMYIHISRY